MSAMRILLAEDHPEMAEALQNILAAEFALIRTVGDGRSLVEAAKRLEPDLIIADVSMPLLSGLDAARQVKEAGLHSKIIFLTMHADIALAKEAFRIGASGYLLKLSAANELITAIREVMNGKCYVSPLITADPTTILAGTEGLPESSDQRP